MLNMESKIVRINRTLYARVPAEEARRLGLREGQAVDIEVRPLARTAGDALALHGKYPALRGAASRRELWGDKERDAR